MPTDPPRFAPEDPGPSEADDASLFWNPQTLLLLSVMVLRSIGFGIIIPTLPYLAKILDASSFEMGLTVTLFSVAQFIASPYMGGFADRFGSRNVMVLGLLIYGVAMVLVGFSPTVPFLLGVRILAGVGLAASTPSANAYAVEITTSRQRPVLLGWMAGAGGVGFMLGPGLGGFLAPIHITVPFVVAGVLSMAAGGLARGMLPEVTSPDALEAAQHPTAGTSLQRLVGQLFGGPLSSLLWLRFGLAFAGGAIDSMLGYFLIDRFAAGEMTTGMVFTLRGLIVALSQAFLIAPLVRWFGEHRNVVGGMTLASVGFVVLALAPSLSWIFGSFVIIAFGVAVVRPLLVSVSSRTTDYEQGETMGFLSSMMSLGRATGPMWAGWVYQYVPSSPFLTASVLFTGFLWLFMARADTERGDIEDPHDASP